MKSFIYFVLFVGIGALSGCSTIRLQSDPYSQPIVRSAKQKADLPRWNGHARRFIYPPAFDVSTPPTKTAFEVAIMEEGGDVVERWTTTSPDAVFPRRWARIPPAEYRFQVRMPGADTLLVDRPFIKSPGFGAVDSRPNAEFRQAGYLSLEALFQDPVAQTWLTTGQPIQDYPLWVHPTKIMGGLVRGMVLFSSMTPDSESSENALTIARRAADFLLDLREPATAALANWPPTYWDGVPREKHPIYMDRQMTVMPAEGAEAFMDLYDATGERKYFEAVLDIFDTYRHLQRPDGTWPLLIMVENAESYRTNVLVPTRVIRILDRLAEQYGVEEYQSVRQKAWDWIFENPVKTFAWEAQFEDTLPKPLYRNMSHREAAELAILILENPESTPGEVETAFELMRYVEDQFIVWSADDPVLWTNFFRVGTGWNGNDPVTGKDWFLPSVVEQYAFYTPISGATGTGIEMYLAAWRRTGKTDWKVRAVALANAIATGQAYHGGGVIPTHLRRTLPEKNWINVGVNAATVLIRHGNALSQD